MSDEPPTFVGVPCRGCLYLEAGCAVTESLDEGDVLILEREPDNPHDSNAIRVCDDRGVHFSYIGREYSSQIAPWMDQGWIFFCVKTGLLSSSFFPPRSCQTIVRLEPIKSSKQKETKDEQVTLKTDRLSLRQSLGYGLRQNTKAGNVLSDFFITPNGSKISGIDYMEYGWPGKPFPKPGTYTGTIEHADVKDGKLQIKFGPLLPHVDRQHDAGLFRQLSSKIPYRIPVTQDTDGEVDPPARWWVRGWRYGKHKALLLSRWFISR